VESLVAKMMVVVVKGVLNFTQHFYCCRVSRDFMFCCF
jgi:hypothetical protein